MTKILEVIIDVYIVTQTRMADQILLVSYGSCHVIPHTLSCCQTADYFNGKNLLTIFATLKSMDGIWRTLGRSDIWLYITNLTQRKNRPSGFFSTLLRQFVNSSKKWFLKLLALDPLIEDFYISCSCGVRRKIGETMSITLKMSSKPWYVHFHGPLCCGLPTVEPGVWRRRSS